MYKDKVEKRICQGDILEDFEYKSSTLSDDLKAVSTQKLIFPYVIVMSQDCDLDRDYKNRLEDNPKNNDKFLNSILVCPAYVAEIFKTGDQLSHLGLKMETWGGDLWKYILKNQNERFHFIDTDTARDIPNLVLDFKHCYTIPREDLYSLLESCKITIRELYREDLSRRFANYLSRIGLPDIPKPVVTTQG